MDVSGSFAQSDTKWQLFDIQDTLNLLRAVFGTLSGLRRYHLVDLLELSNRAMADGISFPKMSSRSCGCFGKELGLKPGIQSLIRNGLGSAVVTFY